MNTRALLFTAPILVIVWLLPGCQKKVAHVAPEDEAAMYAQPRQRSPERRERLEKFKQEPPRSAADQESMDYAQPSAPAPGVSSPTQGGAAAAQIEQPQRMIDRQGTIVTRTSNTDSLANLVANLAERSGGFTENQYQTTITIRVPQQLFKSIFDTLLTYGTIVSFSKTAEDITDAYYDTDAHLAILKRTLSRYVKLVTMVKKDQDKLNLLREIENLRVQIEQLEIQKKVLANRALFSRITVAIEPMAPIDNVPPVAELRGFGWIRQLNTVDQLKGKKMEMTVPQGMVLIKDKKNWFVQSADGSRVWAASIENLPRGDSDFWRTAINYRLSPMYAQADTLSEGNFKIIRFTPYEGSRFVYAIAVRVREEKIDVVQIYFPDVKMEARHKEAIMAMLRKESGK